MINSNSLPKLFEAVHQPVIGTDGSVIIFENPAAVSAFGDMAGQLALNLLPEELLENGAESFICAARLKGRQAAISVLRDGELFLLFVDFIDGESGTLRMTRQIISGLRNSAMGLKMSADRCFFKLDEGEQPAQQHVSMLYHYYYRLLRTITQVDSASLIERGDMLFSPVSTDLIQLCADLADTVSALSAGSGVSISFSTPEGELFAVIDPERMEQLILNLLANSLEHTRAGNSITISLRRAGERIVLSVDDDGDGISQEALSNIFTPPSPEPELSSTHGGCGLGLYIAYGIAQLHSGVLLIESREGEGTHVRLMLPSDTVPAPKFSTPAAAYKRSVSTVLTGLAEVLGNNCFGPKLED